MVFYLFGNLHVARQRKGHDALLTPGGLVPVSNALLTSGGMIIRSAKGQDVLRSLVEFPAGS